jgi:hypothetical protein
MKARHIADRDAQPEMASAGSVGAKTGVLPVGAQLAVVAPAPLSPADGKVSHTDTKLTTPTARRPAPPLSQAAARNPTSMASQDTLPVAAPAPSDAWSLLSTDEAAAAAASAAQAAAEELAAKKLQSPRGEGSTTFRNQRDRDAASSSNKIAAAGSSASAAGKVSVFGKKTERPPTPPRDLMEYAGLTGAQRGEGAKTLLPERGEGAVAAAAASSAGKKQRTSTVGSQSYSDEEDAKSATEADFKDGPSERGSGSPVPAVRPVEDITAPAPPNSARSTGTPSPPPGAAARRGPGERQPSASSSSPTQGATAEGTPKPELQQAEPAADGGGRASVVKRAPSWVLKRMGSSAAPSGGAATPTPLNPNAPSPMTRAMSLAASDISAINALSPDQVAKVHAEMVLAYVAILERRVQQLAAEFDWLTSGPRPIITGLIGSGSGSGTGTGTAAGSGAAGAEALQQPRFGVRGPAVQHDVDRHIFHISVRPV